MVPPHDFRGMFITDTVDAGFPIYLTAELVGRTNPRRHHRYTAVYQIEVFEVYDPSRRPSPPPAQTPGGVPQAHPTRNGTISSSTSDHERWPLAAATAPTDQSGATGTRAYAATSATSIPSKRSDGPTSEPARKRGLRNLTAAHGSPMSTRSN